MLKHLKHLKPLTPFLLASLAIALTGCNATTQAHLDLPGFHHSSQPSGTLIPPAPVAPLTHHEPRAHTVASSHIGSTPHTSGRHSL